MIRRVPGLHCYEGAAAGGGDFVVSNQFSLDNSSVFCRFNDAGDQFHRFVRRRRTQELDGVFRRYRARRVFEPGFVHEMPGGRPVTVAIQKCADDAATQHPFECFLILLGPEFRYDLITVGKTPNVEPLRVRWSTAEAGKIWRVGFLDALFRHEVSYLNSAVVHAT